SCGHFLEYCPVGCTGRNREVVSGSSLSPQCLHLADGSSAPSSSPQAERPSRVLLRDRIEKRYRHESRCPNGGLRFCRYAACAGRSASSRPWTASISISPPASVSP